MPKQWITFPFTRGVVTTRDPAVLELGELIAAENVRLRPGDNIQLHPDRVIEATEVPQSAVQARGSFTINFEDGTEYLLILEVNAGFTWFVFFSMDDLATRNVVKIIPGEIQRSAIQHYGNIWFLGTDLSNWVISEGPAVREMGIGPTPTTNDIDYNGYGISLIRTNTRVGENDRWPTTSPYGAIADHVDAPWIGRYYVKNWNEAYGYEVIFYTITRYDEENNIESAPFFFQGFLMTTSRYSRVEASIGLDIISRRVEKTPRLQILTDAEDNPNIKYRVYRYYAGNTALKEEAFIGEDGKDYDPADMNAVDDITHDEYLQLRDGVLSPVGFLVATITPFTDNSTVGHVGEEVPTGTQETFWADYSETKENVGRSLPIIDFTRSGSLLRTLMLRKPRPWIAATVWSEIFIAGGPDGGQVLNYSPRGELEYQPDIYNLVIGPTRRSDEYRGMTVLNGRLTILTAGSLHRILWILQEGAQFSGPEQVVVSSRHGCVGQRAYSTFSSELGELLVWLSQEGIFLSDGEGWRDGCPDWSVRTALPTNRELENAVLVNDERDYRLILFTPTAENTTIVWSFYYHPSHRKQSGLVALGPTTLPYRVIDAMPTRSGADNSLLLLVSGYDANSLYSVLRLGEEPTTATARLISGYITSSEVPVRNVPPLMRLRPLLAVLPSRPLFGYNVSIKMSGLPTDTDNESHTDGFVSFGGASSAPRIRAFLDGVQAPAVQWELSVSTDPNSDDREWALGPLSIQLDIQEAFDA